MIINLLINFIVLIVGALFSLFPVVTALPKIFGYDIDGLLVTTSGQLHTLMQSLWPIAIAFNGFLFILLYYLVKMSIGFLLGTRTPGRH